MRALLFIISINLHFIANAQQRAPYPNETEAGEFVHWLTECYWDSLELNYTLDSGMNTPSKSWFLISGNSHLDSLFSGQLRHYFDSTEIAYFLNQIDSFKQEDFVPDSLYTKYFNLLHLDTLSEEDMVAQLMHYRKDIATFNPNKIVYDYKWSHEFLNERMVLTNHSYNGSPFFFKTSNYLTYPLFNHDKTIAIIDVTMFCGPLCAWGTTFVFEKTGEGWKKIHKANVRVS